MLATILSGCGGGGNGSAGTNPPATLVITPSAVTVSATTSGPAPSADINVVVRSTKGTSYYLSGSLTNNGIASAGDAADATGAVISLVFKSPASLGPGTYRDTVTIDACYDKSCAQQTSDSPQTVPVTYTVSLAAPQISSLYPAGAAAGGSAFTLQVDGSNFTSQSVVDWNGSPLATSYMSTTELTAPVPAADIAQAGAALVTVSSQAAGVAASNSMTFDVGGPSIISLSPGSAVEAAPGFTLTVNGSNFTTASVVNWNGSALTTSYSSPDALKAVVTSSDLTTAGSIPVTVAVSAGSTAASTPVDFTVQPLAALSLGSVSPATVHAGGPEFYLTVLGQGFTTSSVVQWNGSARTTTYVSTNELLGQISASDIASPETVSVTVQNPAAEGGTSAALPVTVAPPLKDAVAFQINPEHSGAVSFNSVTLPTTSAWSVDVGGSPSYALIADGKVFVTVSSSSASELIALDQSTGATVWGPVSITGPANAAYDNGMIFVITPTSNAAEIQAYDANTGSLKWSTALTGQYGFTSGPTAADGYVFTGGSGSGGTLYALAEASGDIAWTRPVANGDDSTPAVTSDGVYVVYPCMTYDFRPATGESIWQNDTGCDGGGGASPVAANGILFAPNGVGTYNGMQFDAETGANLGTYTADDPPAIGAQTGYFLQGGTLRAINLISNTVQWNFAGDGGLTTSPILVNNYVFIGSSSGNLYALDGASGAIVWQVNLGAAIPSGAGWGAGMPLSGLSAGDGLLIVPAGTSVTAYTLSTNP